ncbi:hypothetical protein [Parapedobacter sp. 10938]|uniref:hypothetical protein n=1 Tax=Parapedobacter flavus TaxID=3110225 RepID=UPI002DBB2873|nr:hypothetical protein [Parapedobacter sp. 10938]MEC3880448.1 hypothetical protein [Parapedobacter sp. 10938]
MENKLSRRKMLAAVGVTGLSAVSTIGLAATGGNVTPAGNRMRTFFYPNIAHLIRDEGLEEGDLVYTSGFYHVGDGGGASYLVSSETALTVDKHTAVTLANGYIATLVDIKTVNYKMFGAVGDGKHDDGENIKAAHAYANKMDVPVVNLRGDYWIEKTTGIVVQTDVVWGKSKFHINEKYNGRSARFHITSKHEPIPIDLTEEEKKMFLEQFRPGVGIIPLLSKYKNCLLVIADENDRIGYRAGKTYGGRVSRMREELCYVEEHGRIIGDIAWAFKNYTSFVAYPADESFLTIEGGAFYVSGDDPGSKKVQYVQNGFSISRSRTIIRNQWVGLDAGKRDVSMAPRNGFYSFSRVYDCLLENVRLIPWEKDRGSKEASVPQGTYGLGGNRMLNVVFRNITAEGSMTHWGVFGTNMNKNFRIERCKLNRVDVHFHCWNLSISDSEIGYKGISITGGGELVVTNTTCRSSRFINFRYDYGGKWAGNINITNCRLAPNQSTDISILSFLSANFDYQYPIGYAHSIKVEDFVVDYSGMADKERGCWVMRTTTYRPAPGRPLFFPVFSVFRNIRVVGGGNGVRLMNLPYMDGYYALRQGSYDGVTLTPNAQLIFEDIQLEELAPTIEEPGLHINLGTSSGDTGASQLLPQITFRNCRHFRGCFGNNILSLAFENCTLHAFNVGEQREVQGDIYFGNCKFKPVLGTDGKSMHLAATLGVAFSNCVFLAPQIGGQSRPDLLYLVDAVRINKTVKYNHLNSRLGNDMLHYCKEKGIRLRPAFVAMLKGHHELEATDIEEDEGKAS